MDHPRKVVNRSNFYSVVDHFDFAPTILHVLDFANCFSYKLHRYMINTRKALVGLISFGLFISPFQIS